MLFKSQDEIFIRGKGCNTLGVRLALLHLHFMSTSIIQAFMGMCIRSFISFTLSLSQVMLLIYIHMLVIMGDQCEKWLLGHKNTLDISRMVLGTSFVFMTWTKTIPKS